MGYVRITIHLVAGGKRSGVRRFPEPNNVNDVRIHAWQLAAEALGREAIGDVSVAELPADDPAVVAFILGQQKKDKPAVESDGEHPYVKQQRRNPPR